MNEKNYVRKVEEWLSIHGNELKAAKAKKYLRDQFDFIGLTSPQRKQLTKEFFLIHGFPEWNKMHAVVTLLWKKKEREFQYFAMELLEKRKKFCSPDDLKLFVFMISNKSWWDTVDFISPKLLGYLFKEHPSCKKKAIEEFMKSGNIWLIRSSLLFQLKYKGNTDKELLFRLIKQSSDEKDFFIRKAIGWVLREYSKSNPAAVLEFVRKTDLSNLSKREALKRI